jgi:hypothetical protein
MNFIKQLITLIVIAYLENTATIDPPTKLSTDPHREAKSDTDDTFEEKAKKATKENTETTDPPKEARTNTDYLFETEVTLSTNKKEGRSLSSKKLVFFSASKTSSEDNPLSLASWSKASLFANVLRISS